MDAPGPLDDRLMFALRALVDGTRLRIVARLATKPTDAATLAAELRLPVQVVNRNLETLVRADLVERWADRSGTYGARLDRVGELGRALASMDAAAAGVVPASDGGIGLQGAWPHDGEPLEDTLARVAPTPDEARTLRAYLVDGRLTTIPAQERKRQVVLRFLLERVFTEDREYPEKEVNQRLALFHADVASLRRYLVDHGYVDRAGGRYRRHDARPTLAGKTLDR